MENSDKLETVNKIIEEFKRTNRVNLSLTDKEYASLILYADNIKKPISIAVREIIETMVEIAKVYDTLKSSYIDEKKKNKVMGQIENQLKDSLAQFPMKEQLQVYSYISKMDELSKFANNWKGKSVKK